MLPAPSVAGTIGRIGQRLIPKIRAAIEHDYRYRLSLPAKDLQFVFCLTSQ